MKFLVTGALGNLGSALCRELETRGHSAVRADLPRQGASDPALTPLDIRDFVQVREAFKEHRPGFVLHAAAETDVDRCQLEPDHAYRVNALGTENMALACQGAGIPMAYVSTGEVFDGEKPAPYTEFDVPNPLNVYARSKYEGEKAVRAILSRHFIVRTAWLVGGGANDRKFVGKIAQKLQTEKEIKAVKDKVGSPTFVQDLAPHLLRLVETERYGLYHLCNKGFCTRYDMARKIAEVLGKTGVTITPAKSDEFPLPAPRGRSEALRNYKLELLGLNQMPPWDVSLEAYLRKEFLKKP